MLIRQKTLLSLLMQAGKPLSPTVFMKLVFLLRQETGLNRAPSFYDFVPYKFGSLRQNGYVASKDEHVALCGHTLELAEKQAGELPASIHSAVAEVLSRYGQMNQKTLVQDVYSRYPWFALNISIPHPKKARSAVYTAGYEGRSVDVFFNDLLKRGIHVVVDVRANPVSRKYGFSGLRLSEFCNKLGLEYCHEPSLGIPGTARAGLNDFASYQRLLGRYEQAILPERSVKVKDLGRLMRRQPSVLICVEKDVRCCHRSRLAEAIAGVTSLEVIHL